MIKSVDSSRSMVSISAALQLIDAVSDIARHQIARGSAEHADAVRMRKQEKPRCMREGIDRKHARLFLFRAQLLGGVGNRLQRGGKRRIQLFVALLAETMRLHAATEEIKAEIEIARVRSVEIEERHRRRAQFLGG